MTTVGAVIEAWYREIEPGRDWRWYRRAGRYVGYCADVLLAGREPLTSGLAGLTDDECRQLRDRAEALLNDETPVD